MANINFHILETNFKISEIRRIKKLIAAIFTREQIALKSLDYIFCSDDYLHELNVKFLNHHTLTDILTFPLSEPGEPIESEIYISIDRVKENAPLFQATFKNELLRVIIHGALHLCGYEDHSSKQKEAMRQKESEYLELFHVEQ